MNDAIIPLKPFVVESDSLSSQSELSLGDCQNTTLAKEVAVLRSHLEYRVNQLQDLVEKEGAATDRAQLLDRITAQMRESLTLNELLKTVVQDVRSALKTNRVVICQFTSNLQGKVIKESVESQYSSLVNTEIFDPRLSRYIEQYRTGKIQAIANINEAGLNEHFVRHFKTLQVQASLIAPIFTRNLNLNGEKNRGEKQLYGLLIAAQCNKPRAWQPSEIEFFRTISRQLSYALDELLLLEHQQTIIQQARRLNQINDHLRQSSRVSEILMTAVEETRDALKCDRVLVYEFRPDWDGKIIAESVDSQWPAAIGAEIDDPCFAKRYVQPYQRGRVKATDNIYEAGLTDCHLRQLEPFAVKANLVAPILVENQLKGLLVAHQCSGPRAWTELEIDLIRNVAIHAGYALDQASALEQQQATAQKAKILNNITYQLRNTQTLDRVFDLLVEQVRQVLKTDQVLIYKYHEDGFGSVVAESIVNNPPAPLLGQKIKDGTLSADDLKVIRRKRVYLIDNIHTCSLNTQIPNFQPYLELLVSPKAKTCLIAPLNTATTLHGLLVINHASSPRVWQDSELDFIKQLTAQVSLALDQLTLLQQQQVIAESERRLNQMSAILQESLKPDEIFRTVIGEARTFLNADRVTIYQFESQWQGRIVTESVAPEFPSALGNELYDPGSTHDIQAYLKGEVTAIADIKQVSLSSFHQRQLKSLQVKAKLVAPIIAKQKLHGLLIVHQCSKPRKWQTHEIDFIRKIAISVGQALNQVFLQQEQQASSQARQLNEICSNIRQTLNPQQICQTAVEELLELMQADRIVIDHSPVSRRGGFNPDVCLSQVTDINPPSPSEVSSPEKTQIIAEAVRSGYSKMSDSRANMQYPGEILKKLSQGEEVIINDVMEASLTPEERQQFHQWEVQAALIIPVFVNQTLYAIATHHCSQTHQWQDSEIERFKQVGLQTGYALEQAQLLQEVQESRSLAEQMMNEQQQQKQQLEHQIETFLAQIEDCFQGNLTVRAQVSEGVMGTVADFFNATIESLQQLVTQVHHSAEIVTTTAAERQQDVEHLSRQAVQQTEIIIDALAQIQTLAHSIEAVATSAQAAQTQVQSVAGILHRGDQAMNRSVEGILSLEKTIRVTARKVKNLGESSQKISRIIKLINQFASQTHVLALNASVEASRMSHQEGGFAMVATEVRTLAEQSSHATAEIEEMIAEIQAETHEVVHAMKVGLKRVLRETELVQRTRKTLTEIVQASNQTHEFVNQIACSANHQAQTSTQLSETMEQVAAIASGSSQQSLQARQAFSQLIQVADQLQQGVEQFKVL